jgi:HK97 family phage major capsid protein
MNEELKKALEGLNETFDKKLEEKSKVWLENENNRAKQLEVVEEIKKEWAAHKETQIKVQEQIDAIDMKLQKGSFGGNVHRLTAISNKLKESKVLSSMKNGGRGDFQLEGLGEIMSLKADDMTQANSFESTTVVSPDYVPGIFYNPDTMFRVRNLMPVGVTNSNLVNVVREEDYDDNTDITTEGSVYKQGDFDLKTYGATVYKITAYIIVSEEMLEDVDGLASYIYSRLPSKLGLKENSQLLYGTGNSEISGLSTNATAYSDNLADSDVQLIDVLADSVRQVKDDEFEPTNILMHPADVMKYLTLKKDDNARYLAPWVFTGGQHTIAGVPIIQTTAITEGTFFTGDFRRAAQVFDRRQNTVEMSNTNEDNFIRGMITVRAAERLALAIYRPSAFIYGSIAAALAQGSA